MSNRRYKNVATNRWVHNPARETTYNTSVNGFWKALFLEPFVTMEEFGWMKVLTTAGMELVGSFLYALAIPIIAFAFTGTNFGLNGVIIGLIQGLFIASYLSWRYTAHLPQYLNWLFTTAAVVHGDMGIVTWAFYGAMQFGGAAIAWPALTGIGAVGPRAYDNVDGSVGALSAPNTAGLVFIILISYFVLAIVYLHNHRIRQHQRGVNHFVHHQNLITGITAAVITAVIYQWGIFSVSQVTYFSAALANSSFDLPITISAPWAIFIFMPLVSGVAAGFVHWLLWNQSGFSSEDIRENEQRNRLDANSKGGVPNTPDARGDANVSRRLPLMRNQYQ